QNTGDGQAAEAGESKKQVNPNAKLMEAYKNDKTNIARLVRQGVAIKKMPELLKEAKAYVEKYKDVKDVLIETLKNNIKTA
ncbi:MAG: hypothetical protein KKA19_02150, partial [Candidatus Margulisbacteria bacterium]|nr:hypothetical protein [Candidatus Margulisiibacteriota bacterium]